MNLSRFKLAPSVWLSVLITLLVSLMAMTTYLNYALDGNIDHHMLSAKMFGIPKNLQAKGLTPMYSGAKETGWDGQFYYAIANDILATQDTPQHIDSAVYRYQRIGLPLVANLVSKVLGQDWVSPTVYYATHLALILLATLAGAWFLQRRHLSGAWILLWSLGIGTQLTLLNALPDAAADAALIVAFVALAYRRWWLYSLSVSLALLSREAYLLIALIVFTWEVLRPLFKHLVPALADYAKPVATVSSPRFANWSRAAWLLFPMLVFAGWHAFIRMRFGLSPASQAHGVLGVPLVSAWHYLSLGFQGQHPLFPSADDSHIEAFSVSLYLGLLTLAVGVALSALRTYYRRTQSGGLHGLIGSPLPMQPTASNAKPDNSGVPAALSLLVLGLFYTAFGNTVMMHWTGYMKAATVFFFLIPFVQVSSQGRIKRLIAVYLIFLGFYFGGILSFYRLLVSQQSFEPYTHQSAVTDSRDYACLKHYDASVKPVAFLKMLNASSILNSWLPGQIDKAIIAVNFTNRSAEAFPSTTGRGGVYYSYHWLSQDGKTVVIDGIRSAIGSGLQPGQSANAQLVVSLPKRRGNYLLRLTPVQEGCAWFYQANPSSAFDIPLSIQ